VVLQHFFGYPGRVREQREDYRRRYTHGWVEGRPDSSRQQPGSKNEGFKRGGCQFGGGSRQGGFDGGDLGQGTPSPPSHPHCVP
jgi:hypothetical protein